MVVGDKNYPYGDSSALKVPAQYEFAASLSSPELSKAVTADVTGLAVTRSRERTRGCFESNMIA